MHTEIKHKAKELSTGAAKDSKHVDKAQNITQKHIELLGQHTAGSASTGGKVNAQNDPYILQRGVRYRLHKQVLEENNNRRDLLAVQESFAQFEAHIIRTIQQAMAAFYQNVGGQADRQKALYAEMVSTTQSIPPDFEWKGFVSRNSAVLIDPAAPGRDVSHIKFPNQDHISTQPLIAGTLERKSRAALKGFSSGYFVVTRSKFLHEFKTDDDFQHDPSPDISLHLPDCTLGALGGNLFHVKGKDISGSKIATTLSMSHEFEFRAPSADAAQRWWSMIREMAGSVGDTTSSVPVSPVSPVSPVEQRNISGQHAPPQYEGHPNVAPIQTSGTTAATGTHAGGSVPSSATTATSQPYNSPVSAGGVHHGLGGGVVPPRS